MEKLTKDYLFEEYVNKKKSQRLIAEELGVTLSIIESRMKSWNLIGSRSKSVHSIDESLFYKPEYYYLMGLACADGYFRNGDRLAIRLNKIDEPLLLRLHSMFKCTNKVGYYKDSVQVEFVSKELVKEAGYLGIYLPKERKKYMNLSFNLEFEEFKYFFRGFIDGDGNIREKGFRFTCQSIDFTEQVRLYIIQYFGIDIPITFQGEKKFPKLEINSYKALHLINEIYTDREDLALERKLEKVKLFSKVIMI